MLELTPILMAACLAWAPLDGELDPCFGTAGVAVDDLGNEYAVTDMRLTSDGSMITVGTLSNGNDWDIVIGRYDSNGARDMSFGVDGLFIYNAGVGDEYSGQAAVLTDGRILVVGSALQSTFRIVLLRLTPNGQLDPTFGTGGIAHHHFLGFHSFGFLLVMLADGRYLVGGRTDSMPCVSRHLADGTLDTSFNGGLGFNTVTWGETDYMNGMAVQSTGKIIIGGYTEVAMANHHVAVSRFNADGTLDTGFGTNGSTLETWTIDDRTSSVALDGEDRIYVGGWTYISGYRSGVSRYSVDGDLDMSFGVGGLAGETPGSSSFGDQLVMQADGKVLITSMAENGGVTDQAAILRYLANGTVDPTFGAPGVVLDLPNNFSNPVRALIRPDGRIVIGAEIELDPGHAFALARLNNLSLTWVMNVPSWQQGINVLDLVGFFFCPGP